MNSLETTLGTRHFDRRRTAPEWRNPCIGSRSKPGEDKDPLDPRNRSFQKPRHRDQNHRQPWRNRLSPVPTMGLAGTQPLESRHRRTSRNLLIPGIFPAKSLESIFWRHPRRSMKQNKGFAKRTPHPGGGGVLSKLASQSIPPAPPSGSRLPACHRREHHSTAGAAAPRASRVPCPLVPAFRRWSSGVRSPG